MSRAPITPDRRRASSPASPDEPVGSTGMPVSVTASECLDQQVLAHHHWPPPVSSMPSTTARQSSKDLNEVEGSTRPGRRAVVEGMLLTGGRPVVVSEDLLVEANSLAVTLTGIPVDPTGARLDRPGCWPCGDPA